MDVKSAVRRGGRSASSLRGTGFGSSRRPREPGWKGASFPRCGGGSWRTMTLLLPPDRLCHARPPHDTPPRPDRDPRVASRQPVRPPALRGDPRARGHPPRLRRHRPAREVVRSGPRRHPRLPPFALEQRLLPPRQLRRGEEPLHGGAPPDPHRPPAGPGDPRARHGHPEAQRLDGREEVSPHPLPHDRGRITRGWRAQGLRRLPRPVAAGDRAAAGAQVGGARRPGQSGTGQLRRRAVLHRLQQDPHREARLGQAGGGMDPGTI